MAIYGDLWQFMAGWWFGTFFIFPYIGNSHPNWLIFFRWVQTTNQENHYVQNHHHKYMFHFMIIRWYVSAMWYHDVPRGHVELSDPDPGNQWIISPIAGFPMANIWIPPFGAFSIAMVPRLITGGYLAQLPQSTAPLAHQNPRGSLLGWTWCGICSSCSAQIVWWILFLDVGWQGQTKGFPVPSGDWTVSYRKLPIYRWLKVR